MAVGDAGPVTRDEAADHFRRAVAGSRWAVLREWHVLRHSACSAPAAGVHQRVIDEVTGHTQDEQRRRLRHLTPTVKADAMRRAFG